MNRLPCNKAQCPHAPRVPGEAVPGEKHQPGPCPDRPGGWYPACGLSSQPSCPGTTGTIVCKKRVARWKKDMWLQHLFFCKVTLKCERSGGAAGSHRAALPADGEDADLPEAAAGDR